MIRSFALSGLMSSAALIAFAPDTGSGGGGDAQDGGEAQTGPAPGAPATAPARAAVHRGAGSYSVMDGDTEVVEKLTKAEAAAFNQLDLAGQNQWIAERPKVDKAGAAAAEAQADEADEIARRATDAEPDGSASYEVTNTATSPKPLLASGAHVTLEAGATRTLVLSGDEKEQAEGAAYFTLAEVE